VSRRRTFTLIELLVAAANALLALSGARPRTQRVTCSANLRTIGHAAQFYLTKHRDAFPAAPCYGSLRLGTQDLSVGTVYPDG
jgi:type II secretory pathway pseudopilin PulG